MALDTRTRSSIYRKLTPILGEEDANALMSEFPASEADELVTKSFLRAETAELRADMSELRAELRGEMSELRAEMSELRAELRGEMSELRAELRGEMSELRAETSGLRADMSSLETRLTLRMGAMGVVILSAMFGLKLFA